MEKYVNELLNFIESCPTCFHTVHLVKGILMNFKFIELSESNDWKLEPNKGYFVVRDDASIIAFKTGNSSCGFHIVASHNDSPCYKIKPMFEQNVGAYKRIFVCSKWERR